MKETPLSRLPGSARKSSFRVIGLGAALVLGIGIVAMGTAMEVSSRPNFCGSCHIMNPYYESWKQSSHKGIACVDCHIPPGVTAELRKKYEALSMGPATSPGPTAPSRGPRSRTPRASAAMSAACWRGRS